MISRAENEIDSLEIVVETEANKASRTLTSVEKKAIKVADALDKCAKSAHGLDFTGVAGLSELTNISKMFHEIQKEQKAVNNGEVRIRTNRSDLKYPAKELKELQKQFKDSKLDINFSKMGSNELQKEIKKNERAYNRLKQSMSDKIALAGTDSIGGKSWYKDVMQLNQYENATNDAAEALGRLREAKKKAVENLKINSSNDDYGEFVEGDDYVSKRKQPESFTPYKMQSPEEAQFEVDKWADEHAFTKVKKGADSASKSVNTFEGQIKRLKAELDELASKGLGQYDTEYDKKVKELAEVTIAKKRYDKEMSNNAKADLGLNPEPAKEAINTLEYKIKDLKQQLATLGKQGLGQGNPEYDRIAYELQKTIAVKKQYDTAMKTRAKADLGEEEARRAGKNINNAKKELSLFKRALNGIKGSAKNINDIKKKFDDVTKAMRNAKKMASSALHPIKSLKSALSENGGNNRGMSLGRMIGSSIMFSSIFGAISQIKEAIKAGSDNLVQYSSEYNKSISSMVSSLLYLKNAWAAAFAPIANVVAPYVSAFIDMLAGAMNKVGQFMAALTGKGFVVQAKKAWKDYAAGLDTATKSAGDTGKAVKDTAKAVKDLANYTLGIDELNVIQPNTDNGSGSSGTGSGGTGSGSSGNEPAVSDMFETIEVPNSMKDLAKMFEDAIAKSDFTKIGRMISNKLSDALESIDWNSIYKKAENFGRDLATFLNGLISPRLFYDLGATIANSINTAFHFANAFAVSFDWKNLGRSLASSLKGFFENWDAGLTGETLGNFAKGILEAATAAIDKLKDDETFKTIGQKLVDFVCGIDWAGLAWDLYKFFKAFKDAAIEFPKDFALGIAQGIVDKICGEGNVKISDIKWLSDISDAIAGTLAKATPIGAIIGFVDGAINQFTRFRDFGLAVGDALVGAWQNIQNAWSTAKGFFAECMDGIESAVIGFPAWIQGKFTLARDLAQTAWKFVGSWFSDKYSEIKKVFSGVPEFFRSGFQKAYDAVKSIWSGLGQFFKGIAENAFKPIKSLVNGVIKGINWVLDKVGSTGNISEWGGIHFANGTDGLANNTLGIVNDQPGSTYKELIMPPNGKAFIPEGRNVMLPLQKGTKIMPADQTKALMGNKPHFAKGIGDFFGDAWSAVKKFTGNVMDYIQDPESIVKIAIDKFTDVSGMLEPWTRIGKGMIDKTFDAILNKIKSVFGTLIPKVDYKATAGVEQWRELAKKALELTNQFSESNLNALLTQMQHESGGNPNAINNWDINAKRGTPSKGLMQVIDPTFHANAMAGYNTNIYDPLSNMIAAINYTVKRYGSLYNGWTARGYKGYENGGIPKSGEIYVANENGFGSEYIGNLGNQHVVANNNQIISGISAGMEHANDETNMLLREVIEYQKALLKKDVSVNMDSKRVDKQISRARSNAGFSFSPA